ncbi:hypothetical protein MHU86_516 [Fragilaria crotonensis]|nr:hypothetical protein MHU86_516 [Fragilaria crotonensis]
MKFFLVVFYLLGSYISGLTIKPANSKIRITPKATWNSFVQQGKIGRTASVDPIAESPSSSASIWNLYGRYLHWIDTSPLVAKSVTAAVVGCFGDVLAQWLEAKTQPTSVVFSLNWVRFNAFFVSGLLFVGPFLHFWYDRLWALGRWLDNHKTNNQNLQVLAQTVVDQTIGVLIFFPLYFYAYEISEALVSSRAPSLSSASNKLIENLGGVFLMQYRVWPLANFVNFKFVPERLRVLTSNVLSVFWNAYLCTRLA